jgi:hypothetical protein
MRCANLLLVTDFYLRRAEMAVDNPIGCCSYSPVVSVTGTVYYLRISIA